MTRRLLGLIMCSLAMTAVAHADWLGFRGPAATGISTAKNLPSPVMFRRMCSVKIPVPGPYSMTALAPLQSTPSTTLRARKDELGATAPMTLGDATNSRKNLTVFPTRISGASP